MADSIKTSRNLKLDYDFVDGDTRVNNIKDPNDSITSAQIEDLNTFIRANNALIGDKYQATFARIRKATIVEKTTTDFDIN